MKAWPATGRLALAAVLLASFAGCERAPASGEAPADPLDYLSGVSEDGFLRADRVRPLRFPADHGAHPAYRSEWWYFTGNLAAGGRDLGFQLTLFRFALAPRADGPGWRSAQMWLGQLAVSDLSTGAFHTAERLSRGREGLAGSAPDALDVRVEDWTIAGDAGLRHVELQAEDRDFGLHLMLETTRPLVLQGEEGLSRKGPTSGNASYYYSATRLAARGEVTLPDGPPLEVSGSAWFDREWSTSALEADQEGWDWFALQLRDGRDLMVYRLRTDQGRMHPYSAGILVTAEGRTRRFPAEALDLSPLAHWRSPATGRTYPVRWKLRAGDLALEVRARSPAQEHVARFEYWEGAVEAVGEEQGRAISGVGYLEMTGYE